MKKTNRNDLNRLIKGLRRHKSFLLSCHVLPEGDAIGSLLAMESLLKRLGKKTMVVAQDPFPERLHCLSSRSWKQLKDLKGRRL